MVVYRVGIIGTGFGGRVHAPMFQHHEGFEVVAIVSVRGNVAAAGSLSGVDNVYSDWKEMIKKESLDLVVVASAVFSHQEMVRGSCAEGIHVLCEKPMALNHEETVDMIAARDVSGNWGFINHEFRYLPARSKVKELMENDSLGKIMHVRYEYTHPIYNILTSKRRGWLGHAEDGGGMLNALGSHVIDSLHWWMDSTLKMVQANLITHVPEIVDGQGGVEHRTADDAYQVIGAFEKGTTVTLDLVTAARKSPHTSRLEVYGEKGTLLMCDDDNVWFSAGDLPFEPIEWHSEAAVPENVPQAAAPYYKAFKPMLDALHETLDTGNKHPYLADFENGQATQRVIDAIRMSARDGRRVEL